MSFAKPPPLNIQRTVVFDLNQPGQRGRAVDFVAEHCSNDGWSEYPCNSIFDGDVGEPRDDLLIVCLSPDDQVQGFARIDRNLQLALPFDLWTLVLMSSKQHGCGSSAMRTFVDLAKQHGVRYLEIPRASEGGEKLYMKFGFKENAKDGRFYLDLNGERIPDKLRQIRRVAFDLYSFNVQRDIHGFYQAQEKLNESNQLCRRPFARVVAKATSRQSGPPDSLSQVGQ